MKTIGLLGGMSWESTVPYYAEINRYAAETLGGLHSAKCVLVSFDFHEVEALQARGDWEGAGALLSAAAKKLEAAGCGLIVICTNTMHRVFEAVRAGVSVPVLHIADPTVEALKQSSVATAALLGTRYTMEQDFYKARLEASGIRVLIPEEDDRRFIHGVIYDELCRGIVRAESRERFVRVIDSIAAKGAQGAILGCTEIGLLVRQSDTALPLFDTTVLHARGAAKLAIG